MTTKRAARLLDRAIQATVLPRWRVAVAIAGAGLVYLTAWSHGRGAAAPIVQTHSPPTVKATVPPSAESADAAAGPSTAPPSSLTLPTAKYRFGFLEFENDTDASTQ